MSWKVKAPGLNSRKATTWLSVSLIRFQKLLNPLQLWRIWHLVSIGWDLHKQQKSSFRKNLRQYSSIGAWLVIALVALAHIKFECPKYLIYRLPLYTKGLMEQSSLSSKSRKCSPLKLDIWKVICQFLILLSHSSFLLKLHNVLQG